jgi:hypothetical protein
MLALAAFVIANKHHAQKLKVYLRRDMPCKQQILLLQTPFISRL